MSFDEWKWKSYNRILESVEPTPFKSEAQKKYKALRKKNDVYTTQAGADDTSQSQPFSGKVKQFGTDRLRFENIKVVVDSDMDLSKLEPRTQLSSDIWQVDKLKPEMSDRLKMIADDFIKSLDMEINPVDILLVGSMAGYNWSDYSDIDLHIVLDFNEISQNKALVEKYFFLAKSKWNNIYDIRIHGHEVELYVQDIEDKTISSAVYSVKNDKWVEKSEQKKVNIDYEGITRKVKEIADEVDQLENLFDKSEYDDTYEKALHLQQKLRTFRKAGLEKQGEFSNENLIYKVLRRAEQLERISKLVNDSYTKLRSSGD